MKWITLSLMAALLVTAAGCSKDKNEDERLEGAEKKEASASPEAKTDASLIKLDDDAVASSNIRTIEIHAGSGLVTMRFPGNIEFNANATAVVQPPIESRLQQWVVNTGDHVKKDDALARLESPQNLGTAILLKAPLDGEVIERNANTGDWTKPGDKLLVVTDPNTMWAVARVSENMVGKILTNEAAAIHALSYPNETFTGNLLRVAASVDTETRTVEFVFAVPNSERKLRAGMFVEFSLATDRVDDKLLVPDEAVQTVKGRSVVFVEQKPGEYRMTPVQLGHKLGESYEVLDDLTNATRIVTSGSFVLKSEALRSEFSGDQD